ncbi:uncharacterized protein A4U43_C04F2130 [Asparagus officinalis]|uniref:Uncharacterized protein n=1 Tax=Asparagus officinalis TaxID=4686 RepID=A0A5P1EXP6_ASPOF|nr:uncharacterized protein LOC109836434 [Asparagus officinalis]XP_020259921.1 uncharacterized protein LOC109836434 [Asparagus officinalis]ONK70846.1 uncharacterized protein A4U43_C04F2130 [Asparagus officinalis]
MGSTVITPDDVLESLMNDGTIDAIRLKIINQLKANEDLKKNTITMVEQSKVLNTPGAENKTKRELFDSLRRELEAPVLEKASKAVWELILDGNGLGKEVSETVERVYRKLSGLDLPIPQNQTAIVAQPEGNKGLENGKLTETETPKTSAKKRTFGEMSNQEGAEALANCSTDQSAVVVENGTASGTNRS